MSTSTNILSSDFYEDFISTSSKARKPSPIWDLLPVELRPGMLSMLAGKPNPVTFPFESITLSVRSPTQVGNQSHTEIPIHGEDLAAALQYGLTSGVPELKQWLTELTTNVHERGVDEGWRVGIGSGSQDLLYKAFSALLNPGDSIIMEAPTYPGVIPLLQVIGCNAVEIPSDSEGIIADKLQATLESWDHSKTFPKLLYTVPFGSNPTGFTTSIERRIQILTLARKYNFLIFEDDPYYFLYYGNQPWPASYFQLEKKIGGEIGRVLRFDSFSKIMAAGFRVGWVTGPSRVINAIELHSTSTTVQPPSISQIILLKLVSQWGIPGFIAHTEKVASFYRQRRDHFEICLQRHMSGIAEWTTPVAAMFFWLKLSLPPVVCWHEGDAAALIHDRAIERGVLLLPGECAYLDERKNPCVRVSFSLLSDDELEEAIKRLALIVREEWERYNKQKQSTEAK
ncbi:TdiD protein [Cyathus striatus]|nr:TdiD protein [Cyathus striatus]